MSDKNETSEKVYKPWQFQPGHPGGPGRPKGSGYRAKYDLKFVELLDERIADGPDSPTVGQRIIADLKAGLMAGDRDTTKWFREQLFSQNILDKMDAVYERERREDMAFLAYRLQKDAGDHAQQILRSRETMHAHMAGRRGGKTDTAARWLVEPLVTQEGARSLYMGLSMTKALDQIWDNAIAIVESLGLTIETKSRIEGNFRLSNGSVFQVAGNTTVDERNKQRGFWWNRVAIDECQSQKALVQLHDEIFGPTLIDRKGALMFLGTGPRVRGTYWEELWTDLRPDGGQVGRRALRLNWTAADNPFIPERETVLDRVRQEHGWEPTNPIYVREYLGQIAYDDDALVWRLGPENYFDDAALAAWIAGQPVTDVRFSAGLDYGFEDADGFAIICHSTSRPERWLVHEHKARRTGVAELAAAVKAGIEYVRTSPLFRSVEDKHFYVYEDTGGAGKKIGFDLATQHGLPIQEAYKQNKDMGVEILQDEVRRRVFKVRKGGLFDQEALKTVFARNDRDELTRVIDDETYHPDVADAVRYAMVPIWRYYRQEGSK